MTGKKAECSRCHAPLIFAITANGRHMPLNKARDLSGTSRYAVWRDTSLRLHVRTLGPGEQPKPGLEHRHMPHHATCPGQQAVLGGEDPEGEEIRGSSPSGPVELRATAPGTLAAGVPGG